MTISDETLMAFADGELDGTARAEVGASRDAPASAGGLFRRAFGRDSGPPAEGCRRRHAGPQRRSLRTRGSARTPAAAAMADSRVDGREPRCRTRRGIFSAVAAAIAAVAKCR